MQSSRHLTYTYVAMKSKQPSHCQHYQHSQYQQSQCSPLIALHSYPRIIKVPRHDPYGLSDDVDIVESEYAEQAEKRLIILSTNAIVQKFTVMVELLRTSITPETVMAIAMYLAVTQHTEYQLVTSKSLRRLFVGNQPIDRVEGGQMNEVVGNDDDESIVEAQQYPQYLFLDIIQRWYDEDGVEGEL